MSTLLQSIASETQLSWPVFFGTCAAIGGASLVWVVATANNPSKTITEDQIRSEGGIPFRLRDGRLLEHFLFGDVTSKVTILALHGANTTGKLFALLDSWAKKSHVKIVSPSLPGFGLSSAKFGYQMREWVQDMQELLAHLQVDQFHVMGTSFGSIHAAALTGYYNPPSAILNVELYVAFAPADATFDPLKGSVLEMTGRLRARPTLNNILTKRLMLPLMRFFSPKDGDVYRSIKHQWEGLAGCADVIYQPWQFEWQKMAQSRRVVIVSGTTDNCAPPANQRRLADHIASSVLIQYEGGHEKALLDPIMWASHVEMILAAPLANSKPSIN